MAIFTILLIKLLCKVMNPKYIVNIIYITQPFTLLECNETFGLLKYFISYSVYQHHKHILLHNDLQAFACEFRVAWILTEACPSINNNLSYTQHYNIQQIWLCLMSVPHTWKIFFHICQTVSFDPISYIRKLLRCWKILSVSLKHFCYIIAIHNHKCVQ